MSSEVVKDLLKTAESMKAFRKENDDVAKLIEKTMPLSNGRKFIGHPPAIDNPAQMEALIIEYFESCEGRVLLKDDQPVLDKNNQPVIVGARRPNAADMAYALGFESVVSLTDYSKKPEFAKLIKRARLLLEGFNNEMVYDRDSSQGARFVLSAVYGYKTEKEVNHTGSVEVKHSATKNLSDTQKLQLIDRAKKSLQSKAEIVEVLDSEISDPIKNETDQETPDWAK